MPATKTTSLLTKKFGNRADADVKKAAAADVNWGFQRLPGGITNGIARLVECGVFEFKPGSTAKKIDGSSAVGELYFRAVGVVLEPKSFTNAEGTHHVEGAQTSIMISLYDTKNGKGEVVTGIQALTGERGVMNELKKLGAEFSGSGVNEVEAICAALKAQGPVFKFSTSLGKATPEYPTPRVFENWNGVKGLENYVAPAAGGDVDDGTGADAPAEPADETTDGGLPVEYTDQGDIDSLVERAKAGDAEAEAAIIALAETVGKKDEVENAADWDAAAAILKGEGGETADETTEETWKPAKDDIYKFKVPTFDPKTKKPVFGKKSTEVEVLSVDEKAETVTLKSLVTGKPVPGPDPKRALAVKWADLIRE